MKTASSSVFLTVRSPFLENSRLHSSGATLKKIFIRVVFGSYMAKSNIIILLISKDFTFYEESGGKGLLKNQIMALIKIFYLIV